MKDILNLLIDDFHDRELPELLPRHQSMEWITGKANVVIGMRRSGKTWYCYQQMDELLKQDVEKERLLYLNFEDERLLPFAAKDFQLILEAFYRKYPTYRNTHCYMFLDEVQRIEGWDTFVRRILDTERLHVCLTGSSSKLLSTEIATSLRGRSITTEIFPFSFREFLSFNGVDPRSTHRLGSQARATLQNGMEQYLEKGGFPEVQSYNEELRRQVLQNYLDVVILRDVIERYAIKNTPALRAMIRHVMNAPATRFSINKFFNTLKSQGLTCTKNSLYDYLDYLVDAFLFYAIPIHTRSEKTRRVNPRKIYVVDPGLLGAMSYRRMADRGALLENLVFMHLRRQGRVPEYYIARGGAEVDFVLPPNSGDECRLIQVCWDIGDPDTRGREVRGLLVAMKELGLNRGTIVTWLDEDHIDDRIEVVPAWRWLLNGQG